MTKREGGGVRGRTPAKARLCSLDPQGAFSAGFDRITRRCKRRHSNRLGLRRRRRAPFPRVSPSILEPARPETFNFRFAADRQFKEKFERLAQVLGVENPLQHMAEIMEQALDTALDKKDLKRKLARRLVRKSKGPDNSRQESRAREISRYIPSHIRETRAREGGLPVRVPSARRDPVSALERESRSNTYGPLLCIEATTRSICGFSVARTTV